jgi:exonuclease SbcC
LVDETIEFRAGLNVILGPNEAGKSTLVNALRYSLFETTKFGQVAWRKHGDFLPIEGGDVFRVSLECTVADKDYSVTKTWGEKGLGQSELVLPGGQSVVSPEAVQDQLSELLGLRRGTWDNVLISPQASLFKTLGTIQLAGDEVADIGELLRKEVLSTDGVSIERLGRIITDRLAGLAGKWDHDADQPERTQSGGQYKSGRGEVAVAWSERESCRNKIEECENHAKESATLLAERTECEAKQVELSEFVTDKRDVVNAINRRRTLELECKDAEKKRDGLVQLQKDWVKRAGQVDLWKREVATLREQISELEKQKRVAAADEALKAVRRKLDRAQGEAADLKDATKVLDDLPQVPEETRDRIRDLVNLQQRLKDKLAAGSLSIRVVAEEPLELDIEAGVEDPVSYGLTGNETVELAANGRVRFRGPSWTIEVGSADGDFDDVLSQHDNASSELSGLLEELKAEDPDSFEEMVVALEEAGEEVKEKEMGLRTILDGETLETLGEKLEASDGESSVLSLEDVAEGLGEANTNAEILVEKIESGEEQLAEWSVTYGTPDDLVKDAIPEAAAVLKGFKENLENTPESDRADADLDALKAEFEDKESDLHRINDQLLELKESQGTLRNKEPEFSELEAGERLEESERRFEQAKHKLSALLRVQAVFKRLQREIDSGTFNPWFEGMERHARRLTGDRYGKLDLGKSQVVRDTDLAIPFNYLSVGTRTCLGLALRLSMAEHFLDGREGFLVMDDPMVDLDPDRQRLASEVISEFAKKWQIIVFTCHPAHAALLTESPIELDRLE